MALQDIDLNRGLMQRPLPKGGPLISMCKKVPGVYFDANGILATDEMAVAAGFDVDGDRRLQAKTEALSKAKAKIDAEFAKAAKELDAKTDAELEEEGLVAPGSLVDPKASILEPHNKEPFITKSSGGEPRVARVVPGGPVKEMKYDPKKQGWTVSDRDTGKVLKSGLDKEDALELLLKE
jgi:hypothetical protein